MMDEFSDLESAALNTLGDGYWLLSSLWRLIRLDRLLPLGPQCRTVLFRRRESRVSRRNEVRQTYSTAEVTCHPMTPSLHLVKVTGPLKSSLLFALLQNISSESA